jgi:hypothetical protein
MGSPAAGAAGLLVDAGLGTSNATGVDWAIKVGRLTDSPDRCIAMFDTPGQSPNPRDLLDYVAIQALIRGPKDDYAAGWQKAKDVKDVLLGMFPRDVGDDHWDGVVGMGSTAFLRYDDNNRPLFSVNFRIFLEEAQSTLTHRTPL